METYVANFILAPSNRYVGWVVYNNGYFFGSGNTLTRMLRNIKLVMYKQYGRWKEFKLVLANKSTPKEFVPLEKMADRFKTMSYFAHKTKDRVTKDQIPTFNRIKQNNSMIGCNTYNKVEGVMNPEPRPRKTNQPEYICKEINDEMVVFEIKEIARYKLFNHDTVLKKYLQD